MSHPRLNQLLQAELDRRAEDSLLRTRVQLEPIDAVHVRDGDRVLVNFASNNYLGLTHFRRLAREQRDLLNDGLGIGSGASPLVTGYTRLHADAEQHVAAWKGAEAAVLLPSGYQAAHAAIQTFAGLGNVRFLIDKLTHASMIDAVASLPRRVRVFPHNHLEKLRRLLSNADPDQLQVVVTESIFSMDGDAADLAGLSELKREHGFALLLDEAHGTGVYGQYGQGYAAEQGFADLADVMLVTFSKAMGLIGGAVCGPRAFCDGVVNWGRAYIYSTSIPPLTANAILIGAMTLEFSSDRQARVRMLAARVRAGLKLPPGDCPIIPLILGSEQAALEAASELREKGMLVIAIRPPTVPKGTSRLRVTVSSEHTDEEVARLIDALSKYRNVK